MMIMTVPWTIGFITGLILFFIHLLIESNFFSNVIKKYNLNSEFNYFSFHLANVTFITRSIILFIINFLILTILSNLGINLFDNFYLDQDLYNHINETDPKVEIKPETNITINNGKLGLNFSGDTFNNLAAAASSAGGGALAYQVGKSVKGGALPKTAAGVLTYAGIQLGTAAMGKLLSNNNSSSSNPNLVMQIDSLSNNSGKNISFDEYPLNLLPDIDGLISVEIGFLVIILNIFIGNLLASIDVDKYLSRLNNYKLGRGIIYFLKRYINVWSKTSKYLAIYCWVALTLLVILTKFAMVQIVK